MVKYNFLLAKYKILTFLIVITFLNSCGNRRVVSFSNSTDNTFVTPFEKNDNYSASYSETIAYYQQLSDTYPSIRIIPFGNTDSGYPLHEVILSNSHLFDAESIRQAGKAVLLVNNAIHPGEPCGVDASMMLSRNLISDPELKPLLENTVLVIIPYYNISGGLNRGSYSRANQEGPEEYGFRGNAQHLDLNRDFIKCDTKNAASFNKLFNKWNPDVFIDNHTSNGADYQYVITLIATQKDKLQQDLAQYMTDKMLPELYDSMEDDDYEMTPYVYARSTPDEGIAGFLDLPRYSSGYAALHHTISFMPETHMLKPYKDRVWSTYHFMENMLHYLHEAGDELKEVRAKAVNNSMKEGEFALNWALDFDQADEITFKGYEAKYKPSKVTGQSRLFYDRDEPYQKEIPFYNTYTATAKVKKPRAYLIPQAYHKVIERLQWNKVEMEVLSRDTVLEGIYYYIENYNSPEAPYEGHYLHRNVEVREVKEKQLFRSGDIMVRTGQSKDRYIVETLEPTAPDSWFAWNFMDGILMRKEYFSSYVFEDLAEEILNKDRSLRRALEKKKKEDPEFAQNARAQLNFIYEHSSHAEEGYRRYPVFRVER